MPRAFRSFATDEDVGSLLVPNLVGGIKLQVPAVDAARAKQVLAELQAEFQPPPSDAGADDKGVTFNCPTCKAEIWFPSDRRGHVEECPECGAYVDVPDGTTTGD